MHIQEYQRALVFVSKRSSLSLSLAFFEKFCASSKLTRSRLQHCSAQSFRDSFKETRHAFLFRTHDWLRDQARNPIINAMTKLLRIVSTHVPVRAKEQNDSAYLTRSTQAAVEAGDFMCRPHSIISIKLRRIMEPARDAHGKVNRDSHPN